MEKIATNLADYFDLPNPGLRAYLSHVVEGNREVYRPPFWNKQSPAKVLSRWGEVLLKTDIKSKFPSLYKYELEMKGKVGPMSYQLPLKGRLRDVENYYTMVRLPSVPVSANAVQAAGEYFSPGGGIRLRTPRDTAMRMRLDTNSGNPKFQRRSSVLEETLKMLDPTSMSIDSRYEPCAVLGWRGQEGGPSIEDVKQRVVWMYMFALNMRELQLYQPLIEAFQAKQLVPAWVSNECVDRAITATWAWKSSDTEVICTDFSKFDQHFNSDMSACARQILEKLVTPSALARSWFDTIFPQKYSIPLVCSEEITYVGTHGMGSGSGGTNADETLTHKALQYEAALDTDSTLCPSSQCLGDDGYLCTDRHLTVDQVVKTYSRHGQEMNVDKQYVSAHDCIYLRRWHHEDYTERGIMVGVYPTFRALGRLLYQERYYDPELWGPKMVTLRAWSILENCNHHPCFEEFVDFVMKGDKYRLGLDIPNFIQDVGHLANEASRQLPDFMGFNATQMSDKKGIQEWRIYKYLKSKA